MPSIDKLGKYEIRRELGRGAMGVVYEAYDPMIKRIVALKTIRADQLQREDAPVVLARFRREAQAAGRLNHPNIVSIYDFDEDDGTSFIAMEYVTGRDLRECFEGGERFKTADAVRLMGQILDALDYSHRQGVIHRDVKPANVFLADGSVKVADFGIAHIDSSSLTQDGSVMGTPSYMSPEQILGLAGRRALGSLFRRRDSLSVPHRRAAVRRLVGDDDAEGAEGGPAAAFHAERAAAGRDRCGRAQGARKASRRPLSNGRRVCIRFARCHRSASCTDSDPRAAGDRSARDGTARAGRSRGPSARRFECNRLECCDRRRGATDTAGALVWRGCFRRESARR